MRLLALCIAVVGCAGVVQTAKKDATLARDYSVCEAEAKAVARASATCAAAIDGLVELMAKPECEGFGGQSVEGGIKVGGVTYICREESTGGR